VETFREDMDRWHPVERAIREVHRKIAMDILVYSKAEIRHLKENGNDFIKEIERTGRVLYEK
jgi:hypothetical protein